MNTYYKNFILYGDADFYCLICNEAFGYEEDVDKHIKWENHRKLLKTFSYFNKFKNNRIYKVGNYFYCEICNYVARDVNAMSAHVAHLNHRELKSRPAVDVPRNKPIIKDTGHIILYDIIVNIEEWNTVEDNICLLCDTEVSQGRDFITHIVSTDHIINLIQNKVVFEERNRCYRQITLDLTYCFICKKSVTGIVLKRHWEDAQHIKNTKDPIQSSPTQPQVTFIEQRTMTHTLIDTYKRFFVMDPKNNRAVCKTCRHNVRFNNTVMGAHAVTHIRTQFGLSTENHVLIYTLYRLLISKWYRMCQWKIDERFENLDNRFIYDYGAVRKKFRVDTHKRNIAAFVRLLPGYRKAYCVACKCQLTYSTRANLAVHILGKQHNAHTEQQHLWCPFYRPLNEYRFVSINKYIETFQYIHKCNTFVINSKLKVPATSFALVKPIENAYDHRRGVKCFPCNIYYEEGKHDEHFSTVQHKIRFLESPVITTFPDEFIRLVRPHLFHCGFCNRPISYFSTLIEHLNSTGHKRTRAYVKNRTVDTSGMLLVLSPNTDVMYYQLTCLKMFYEEPKTKDGSSAGLSKVPKPVNICPGV